MSNKIQAKKNLELVSKLTDYITKNPQVEATIPSGASYVFFSATDKKLNQANLELAKSLSREGKVVVKAQELKDKENPWKFVLFAP